MSTALAHDTAAAIDFLRRFHPDTLWVLTSIIPDGKSWTETFRPDQEKEAAAFIEKRQGKENLYFHVNPTVKALTNKASKEEVARLAYLHVDIDPRAGENLEEEQARALKLLQNFKPSPTVILFSGGGYQGFWRLNESPKLEINGSIEKAEELEAYNQQLEKVFGADHCFNVDRIMRLPGTINLPTAKKAKKGRKPALASLVALTDAVYDIEQFTAAVRVQSKALDGELDHRPRLKITGNVPDIGVDELSAWAKENGKTISEHCLALIATGSDPVDPAKYPSRSEALFRVCCDLVRAEVPDEMIFAVITGNNEIAASVKDKPNWESYALRQIERAHEEAIEPWLRKLNERHAVISDVGGKCRIISEFVDPSTGLRGISLQSFEDFRNRYSNIQVLAGEEEIVIDKGNKRENRERKTESRPIFKPLGAWWISQPLRRQYDRMTFAPGREIAGVYNLWRGFAFDPMPGDLHQSFLNHLKDNVCTGNPVWYSYLVRWMARAVQQPASPGEVAVALRGGRGTGKSFFGEKFGELFGRHFLLLNQSKQLTGQFNAHLQDAVVVFGDEALFAGDRAHESVLKTLITASQLAIEGKGRDLESGKNFVHLILASNDDWVVPAGTDERRFFALEVGDARKQDHDYFKRIQADLDAGGYANLLHYLLTLDIKDFEVRSVPPTPFLDDQKARSLRGLRAYLYELLSTGERPPGAERKEVKPNALFVPTRNLTTAAKTWLEDSRYRDPITDHEVKNLLGKTLGAPKYRESGGRNGYWWNLAELRAAWDRAFWKVESWEPEPDDYYMRRPF